MISCFDRVELVPDLVQDREAVVEAVVEHLVQEPSRALREELLAEVLVGLAAHEQVRHRMELDVRQRDEVVVPEEDVELGRVQALDGLVVERKVEDDEEVLRVVVDLRSLPLREHVLDVEGMPAKALGQRGRMSLVGRLEVDPGKAAGLELSGLGTRDDDLARGGAEPGPLQAWQARHRY
jgi:hypothetical protein